MNIAESTSPDAPDVVILAIAGRLDATTAEAFGRRLSTAVEGGARAIVLDLAAMDYVNSVGLRTLLVAAKQLMHVGGRIVLCGASPGVHALLEASGFLSVCEIAATQDEGLALVR